MARKRKRTRRLRRHKRWALNCERVFVVLTSGPFPSGDPKDDLVDAHLSFCPDCRQLAEALRPTESMLADSAKRQDADASETIAPGLAAEKLPGYWKSSQRLSALDDLDFSTRERSFRSESDRRFGWRLVVAIGLIAAVVACALTWLWRAGV